MLCTVPTFTPRSVTGAPTARPATESRKYATTRNFVVNRFCPANKIMAAAPSASAPSTNAPTAVALPGGIFDHLTIVIGIRAFPVHESAHGRMLAGVAQYSGRPPRDRGFGCRVQKNPVIANAQKTGQ